MCRRKLPWVIRPLYVFIDEVMISVRILDGTQERRYGFETIVEDHANALVFEFPHATKFH